MPVQFYVCKFPAGKERCGAQFHWEDRDEYLAHVAAHGVPQAQDLLDEVQRELPWWDEEGGYSLHTTVSESTPLLKSQFGDGTEQAMRERAKANQRLFALEQEARQSGRKTPASSFASAKVIAADKAAALQAPEVGLLAGELNAAASAAVVAGDPLGVPEDGRSSSRRRARKGTNGMARNEKNTSIASRYAAAGVVNLAAPTGKKGEKGARRICVTTGRGFTDASAIRNILQLVQKNDPQTVVTNQGRWDGDKLVAQIARNMGLTYEETLPKFLEARRAGAPLIGENERMTPEQDAEFGFKALQNELATTCEELHVFGSPNGPQRGLIDAFNEAGKSDAVARWGSAID